MIKVMKSISVLWLGMSVVLLTACSSLSSHSSEGTRAYGTGEPMQVNGVPVKTLMQKTTFHFGFDKDVVNAEDIAAVEAHGLYLAHHPNTTVTLEGHTDQRGSREYNIGLGERRDGTVARILIMSGARADQIKQVSYGQEKPVAFGHTPADYAQNRRVEIVYH